MRNCPFATFFNLVAAIPLIIGLTALRIPAEPNSTSSIRGVSSLATSWNGPCRAQSSEHGVTNDATLGRAVNYLTDWAKIESVDHSVQGRMLLAAVYSVCQTCSIERIGSRSSGTELWRADFLISLSSVRLLI